jgi:hypothetical protein
MRRLITSCLLAAFACGVLATAGRADTLLFDYVGFDYETPNNNPGFGEVGSTYVGLGTCPFLFAPLTSDQTLNEYTYVMEAVQSNVATIGSHTVITFAPGATIKLYADSRSTGTEGTFGTNPPNATAPSTFNDGENILEGALTSLQYVFDTNTGTGYFEAVFTVTGGTQLGNFPLNQRTGWTFSGVTANALNIPQGYAHQVDGQTFLNEPTTTRRTTWGKLKAGYR